MEKTTISKEQILINGASMLMVKVTDPGKLLEFLTEAMYQTFIIAGSENSEKFKEDDIIRNRTFVLKEFIDKVISKLFYDEEASGVAIAAGIRDFLHSGGLDGYDDMLKTVMIAYGNSTADTDWTSIGMDWIIPNLGVLCEFRKFIVEYEEAEELEEAA